MVQAASQEVPAGPRRARRGLRRLLVALASGLLTLALLEVGLRLFRPVPFAIEQNMYFEPDPFTGYRLRPGSVGSFGGIPAVVNDLGMRDDPTTLEKPVGVRRILVLGDSFTVGASVAQDEVWTQILERRLADHFAAVGARLEVLNDAVGGFGPFQYAQEFEQRGLATAPDAVLVGFFVGNDTYDQRQDVASLPTAVFGRRVSREAAESVWIGPGVFLHEHLHLARFLRYRGARDASLVREDCEVFPATLQIGRAHV